MVIDNRLQTLEVEVIDGMLYAKVNQSNPRDILLKGYTQTQIPLESCSAIDSTEVFNFPYVSAHCVYKVIDPTNQEVLYIGKSSNGGLSSRLRTHLNSQKTFNGYDKVDILLACFSNECDCLIYELYLIGLHFPTLNKDKPLYPSSISLQYPLFEYYTTIKPSECNKTLGVGDELSEEDNNRLINTKFRQITTYINKNQYNTITFEEFSDMVKRLRVDLRNTGIGKGSWKFNYELSVYEKVL